MLERLTKGWGPPLVVVAIGFTATVAQVVLLREFLSVMAGNELAIGLVLAGWLLWTAIGSQLVGRLLNRCLSAKQALMACLMTVAVTLPGAILAARSSRQIFQSVPGEIPGPAYLLFVSVLLLAPFCLASGAEFYAASQYIRDRKNVGDAEATSTVYCLEAGGSAVGGLAASLVLIEHFSGWELSLLLSGLSLGVLSLLITRRIRRITALCSVAVLCFLGWLSEGVVDRISVGWLWDEMQVVESVDSRHARLTVVDTGGVRSLYGNGVLLFARPDEIGAQESVHYALLVHNAPRRVLLIGGGLNGALEEVLKHPSIESVDYVELDPAVLELGRTYFSGAWLEAVDAGRVRLHLTDGRWFVKNLTQQYDVVLVNLPDPRTAQLNRFYSREFFREVKQGLEASGVFSFSVEGTGNYYSDDLSEFLASIDATLGEVFPEVAVMPGDRIYFFAAPQTGTIRLDEGLLEERYRERDLNAPFVGEGYLRFVLVPDRIESLKEAIGRVSEPRLNEDFNPVAFYLNSLVWAQRFGESYGGLLRSFGRLKFPALIVIILLFSTLARLGMSNVSDDGAVRRVAAVACTGVAGFTLLGGEVILLIGFQTLYGYLYHGLALILAAFMVGLTAGTWWALRKIRRGRCSADPMFRRSLALAQAAVTVSTPLVVCVLYILARVVDSAEGEGIGGAAFAAMAFGVGFVGGGVFPLASRAFFLETAGSQYGYAWLYAFDLLGAALGAVLISWVSLPVFGYVQTAVLIAAAGAFPLLLVTIRRRRVSG